MCPGMCPARFHAHDTKMTKKQHKLIYLSGLMLKRGYNRITTRNPLERHAYQSISYLNVGNWGKINIIYTS
jgi:hypothetical protein